MYHKTTKSSLIPAYLNNDALEVTYFRTFVIVVDINGLMPRDP